MQALHVSERLRDAHPDLSTHRAIVSKWGGVTYRYISALKEGARKMVRMLPETARKGEFRRNALQPTEGGRARWECPTTFLTERPAGFWLSMAAPRLAENAPRNTWKTFTGLQPKRPTDGGRDAGPDYKSIEQGIRLPNNVYPAGKPLTEAEHKARRNRRPKSLNDGRSLCWDYSRRAGC